jgi:hypothetical protein
MDLLDESSVPELARRRFLRYEAMQNSELACDVDMPVVRLEQHAHVRHLANRPNHRSHAVRTGAVELELVLWDRHVDTIHVPAASFASPYRLGLRALS